MTEKTEPTKLTAEQLESFKMYSGFALSGILSSIPFGVNIEPNMIAQAVKNTALAMIEAQKEVVGE